jgi:hypothetical protein
MKNFEDIQLNPTYQLIVGDLGNFPLFPSNIDWSISNINIPSKSIILGNKSLFCGYNISIPDTGEINSYVDSTLESIHIKGNLGNISIKDNSLSLSKLQEVETERIFSTSGELTLGDNLEINNGKLSPTSGSITINTGLPVIINPPSILANGIYFVDDSGFPNITLANPNLELIYIINKTENNISLGDTLIYGGEICLISLSKKVKTNYVGNYFFDTLPISGNTNTKYDDGDVIIQKVEKIGTENNPIIYLYSKNNGLVVDITGADNTPLVLNTQFSYLYNSAEERYEISLIGGSSSIYFGTYEPGGINLTGNNPNTSNGIYKIFVKEFNQTSKEVHRFSINTTKSIIVGINIISLYNPELIKSGNLLDSIIAGDGVTIQSAVINGNAYTLGSTLTTPTYTFVLNSNGTYTLTLSKKSVGILPSIEITAIDENFVTDSGERFFSMERDIPISLSEIKLDNSITTNLNIFDYFSFYGSEITITNGILSSSNIASFGTISLSSEGDLTVIPTAFSTESTTLSFTLDSGEIFSLPLKLNFAGVNSASMFKLKINGYYSEIKYKDNIDPEYKTFDSSNDVLNITRINNESLGNEISENGTWYDGNYYAGFDGEFLTIEDELVDPPDNITQRSYVGTDIAGGYNTYLIEFNASVGLEELLVSPAINDNQFLPLPSSLTLWKSLDNGVTWLKINDYTIGANNIPAEWYPYAVTNKLEALRQTGGFFKLII